MFRVSTFLPGCGRLLLNKKKSNILSAEIEKVTVHLLSVGYIVFNFWYANNFVLNWSHVHIMLTYEMQYITSKYNMYILREI